MTGILKKTLVTPGGEAVISSVVMITPLHCGKIVRSLDNTLKRSEDLFLVSAMVLSFSPPEIL